MKRLAVALMFICGVAWAGPTTTITIPNNFTPNTTIQSSQVNNNFTECQNQFNSHTHNDITTLGTVTSGVWNAGNIISGQWLSTAIATGYGGTGEDFSAVASRSIIYFDATGSMSTLAGGASGSILTVDPITLYPKWLTQGTAGQVLISQGATKVPYWGTPTTFGAWDAGAPWLTNTTYLAATDGFVMATSEDLQASTIEGFTDGATPPTTSRVHATWNLPGGSQHISITMPVRKGDYWHIDGAAANTIFWLPAGY